MSREDSKDLISELEALASNLPGASRLDPLTQQEVEDRTQDRDQRKLYARWAFRMMAGQLIILNLLMIGVGVGCINYSDYLFHAYVLATFGEIVGVVYLVAKYLFPTRAS